MQIEIKQRSKERSIKFMSIKQGASSSCRNASEDQGAEHPAHVEVQIKIKQRSVKFMWHSK